MKQLLSRLLSRVGFPRKPARMLEPESFAREIIAALRRAMPDHRIEVLDPLTLRITSAGGHQATVYLHNAYQNYRRAPADKDRIIRQHVATHAELQQEATELDPQSIVPSIKTRAWVESIRGGISAGDDPALVAEPLNDALSVVYAEDTPNSLRYFPQSELRDAGLEHAQLRHLALANLRRKLPEIDSQRGPLLTMLIAGGNFESSLLLLDELWEKQARQVSGEVVIAVPSRDVLIHADSARPEAIERLRELAQQALQDNSYPITDRLFVYRNGGFEGYDG